MSHHAPPGNVPGGSGKMAKNDNPFARGFIGRDP
jgi:hypothetical protein